jgi:hypothetical protein
VLPTLRGLDQVAVRPRDVAADSARFIFDAKLIDLDHTLGTDLTEKPFKKRVVRHFNAQVTAEGFKFKDPGTSNVSSSPALSHTGNGTSVMISVLQR